MNESEQAYKQLPVGDDIIFNLIDTTTIGAGSYEILNPGLNPFSSTKEFVDKLARYFISMLYPSNIYGEGIKAKVLEPGKKWVTGIVRLRLVVEFIPDEPEENNKNGQFGSTLDDIRNLKL